MNKYYNTRTRILWHIGFWLGFLLYYVMIIGSFEGESYSEVFISRALNLPVKVVTTYFVLYMLIPRYFIKKKILAFSILLLITLLIAGFLQHLYYHFILNPILYPERTSVLNFQLVEILKNVLSIYPVVSLAAFVKVGKHWYEKDKASQMLQKEKMEAELKFLKAQIHPHFLFNTLNSLYALTLKKSDQASEVVLKLSYLLDYMLYEGNAPKVSLKKELDLIDTYIGLEKIRYGEKLCISYQVKGQLAGKTIAPLIILPFIENSFKHGVSQQLEGKWIKVDIEVKEHSLVLRVENSKNSEELPEDSISYKEGIGLCNVKRRLELLYGKNHELIVQNEKDVFLILLSIHLHEPLEVKKRENKLLYH